MVAQYRTEEIPATIASFRKIDYTDPRLQKAACLPMWSKVILVDWKQRPVIGFGIYRNEQIHRHFGCKPFTRRAEIKWDNREPVQFTWKRSLFKSSEYLALKLLNEQGCTINDDLAAQLESYRAMKIGKIAPDIDFKNDLFAPGYKDTNPPQNYRI